LPDLFCLRGSSADWEDSLFILAISLDFDFEAFGLDFRCCLGISRANYYKIHSDEPFPSQSISCPLNCSYRLSFLWLCDTIVLTDCLDSILRACYKSNKLKYRCRSISANRDRGPSICISGTSRSILGSSSWEYLCSSPS
jgi:hypothetical protein